MRPHVTDEELLDLLEGGAERAVREHASACAGCGARLSAAAEALALARPVEVPEPSPLFWEAFRRNVGRRIAADPPVARRGWLWPLAAAAAAVLAMVVVRPVAPVVPPAAAPATVVPAWSALPGVENDAAVPVLEGLIVTAAGVASVDEGGGLGAFVAGLTDDESDALAESLRREAKGGTL